MRVFCQAERFAGVNIDMEMVCQSVAWLIQNQRGDGALHEVHAVVHREMVVRTEQFGRWSFFFCVAIKLVLAISLLTVPSPKWIHFPKL